MPDSPPRKSDDTPRDVSPQSQPYKAGDIYVDADDVRWLVVDCYPIANTEHHAVALSPLAAAKTISSEVL